MNFVTPFTNSSLDSIIIFCFLLENKKTIAIFIDFELYVVENTNPFSFVCHAVALFTSA